jgi:hypothetical protein
VELFVMRVNQCDILQAFIFIIMSVSNDLNLWLMRDGLEIWVKD